MWNEGMSKNQQKLKNNNIQTGRFSAALTLLHTRLISPEREKENKIKLLDTGYFLIFK